jgi:hypothetical protein
MINGDGFTDKSDTDKILIAVCEQIFNNKHEAVFC